MWPKMIEPSVQNKALQQKLVLEPAVSKGELDTFRYSAGAMPEKGGTVLVSGARLLLMIAFVPIVCSLIYNFAIAADRYASVASFVVRQNKPGSGVLSILDGGGLSRSDDSSYAVAEYMQSRDAVTYLDRDGFLTGMFAQETVDIFSRFPSHLAGKGNEDLFDHFQHYLDVEFDSATGITSFEVQAFTPEQAQQLAQRLLEGGEELVNELNKRAQKDSIKFANELVADATEKLRNIQAEMTAFRNEAKLLSPDAEIEVSTKLIANLMGEISRLSIEIGRILSAAPESPRLPEMLRTRDSLQAQLDAIRQTFGGEKTSTSAKIERYEEIALRREIAEKELVNATATSLKAKQDMAVSRLYVDRVVNPSNPDRRAYPQRLVNLLLTIFITLSVYSIVRTSMKLIMEEN